MKCYQNYIIIYKFKHIDAHYDFYFVLLSVAAILSFYLFLIFLHAKRINGAISVEWELHVGQTVFLWQTLNAAVLLQSWLMARRVSHWPKMEGVHRTKLHRPLMFVCLPLSPSPMLSNNWKVLSLLFDKCNYWLSTGRKYRSVHLSGPIGHHSPRAL